MMEENRAVLLKDDRGDASEMEREFDELLREPEVQAEFERRIAQALDAARTEWMQEAQRQVEQARAEAEARARMSGEARAEYDLAQREAQLELREQEVLRRELRADAVRMIGERGLPPEIADVLDYAGAERMRASLDAAERAFRAAVQRGVEMRMRGGVPSAGSRDANVPENDDDYYRTRYAQGRAV